MLAMESRAMEGNLEMKIKDIGEICGLDCPLFDGRVCGTPHGGICDMYDAEMELEEAVKEIQKLEEERQR